MERVRLITVFALVLLLVAAAAISGASPAEMGSWAPPFWEGGDAPFDPPSLETSAAHPTAVSIVVLPDGRLLYWNGIEASENTQVAFGLEINEVSENSRARILDLRSGAPQWSTPTFERGVTDQPKDGTDSSGEPRALSDMFCADQKVLYDGTVLIAGGSEWRENDLWGDDETKIFDPASDTFSLLDPMNRARWYPSLATASDGKVYVFSGVEQLINSFRPDPAFSQVREVEVFDPADKQRGWQVVNTSPFSLPLFSRFHLLPNGKLFYGGVAQTWSPFGETADEATWMQQRFYNPQTNEWEMKGPAKYGVRGAAFSVLLRLEPPYDTARILIGGGTLGPSPGSFVATTLSEVVTVRGDTIINEPGVPKPPLAGLAGDSTQMRNARWYSSGVILPTGEVLAFSGGDVDEVVDPGSEAPVKMAELYDPKTNTWTELSEATRGRTYHNSAVLLPDGRVLIGGHSPIPAHYHRHDNPLVRGNNFKDSTFEIYSPPYLFRGDRPEIRRLTVPSSGKQVQLVTDKPASEVVLVRLPAVTHITDADQRAVSLPVSPDTSGSRAVIASLPNGGDGSIVPPGTYYLFVLRHTDRGPIPSAAKIVTVRPAGDGSVSFAASE